MKKMTIRIPIDIDIKIQQYANAEMISKNAWILRACRNLLNEIDDNQYVTMLKEGVSNGGITTRDKEL